MYSAPVSAEHLLLAQQVVSLQQAEIVGCLHTLADTDVLPPYGCTSRCGINLAGMI